MSNFSQFAEIASAPGYEYVAASTISAAGKALALRTDGTVEEITASAGVEAGETALVTTFFVSAVYIPTEQKVAALVATPGTTYGYNLVVNLYSMIGRRLFITGSYLVTENLGSLQKGEIIWNATDARVLVLWHEQSSGLYGKSSVFTSGALSFTGSANSIYTSYQVYGFRAFSVGDANFAVMLLRLPGDNMTFTWIQFPSNMLGGPWSYNSTGIPAISTSWSSFPPWTARYNPSSATFMLGWRDLSSMELSVALATVSGYSMTWGSVSTNVLSGGATGGVPQFTPAGNSFAIIYSTNSNGTRVIGATTSGTTPTFGSSVQIDSTNVRSHIQIEYDPQAAKLVASYVTSGSLRAKTGTISGTTLSFGSEETVISGASDSGPTFSPPHTHVFAYHTAAQRMFYVNPSSRAFSFSLTKSNALRFLGFSQASAAASGKVMVTGPGQVDGNQTGLTQGTIYYVTASGGLSTTNQGYGVAGTAQNATRIAQAASASGTFTNFVFFETSGTWTVPNGVTRIKAYATGGGAGASSGYSNQYGGGGGGTSISYLEVTPGDVLSFTIGSGGAVGTNGGATTLIAPGAVMIGRGGNQINGGGASGGQLNIPGQCSTGGYQQFQGGNSYWGGAGPFNSAGVFWGGGGGAYTNFSSYYAGYAGVVVIEY